MLCGVPNPKCVTVGKAVVMYVGSDLSLTLGYAVLGLAVRVISQAYCHAIC